MPLALKRAKQRSVRGPAVKPHWVGFRAAPPVLLMAAVPTTCTCSPVKKSRLGSRVRPAPLTVAVSVKSPRKLLRTVKVSEVTVAASSAASKLAVIFWLTATPTALGRGMWAVR